MYYAAIRLYGAPQGTCLGHIVSIHLARNCADAALVREYNLGLHTSLPKHPDILKVARVPQSYTKGDYISQTDIDRFLFLITIEQKYIPEGKSNDSSPNHQSGGN